MLNAPLSQHGKEGIRLIFRYILGVLLGEVYKKIQNFPQICFILSQQLLGIFRDPSCGLQGKRQLPVERLTAGYCKLQGQVHVVHTAPHGGDFLPGHMQPHTAIDGKGRSLLLRNAPPGNGFLTVYLAVKGGLSYGKQPLVNEGIPKSLRSFRAHSHGENRGWHSQLLFYLKQKQRKSV